MQMKNTGLQSAFWALWCLLGLSVSCSSDGMEEIIDNVPEQARGERIRLSATCPSIDVITRLGVGGVGDLASNADSNVWKSNPLHVYAIFKDATDLSLPYQDENHYCPTILLGGERKEYLGQLGYAPYMKNSGEIDLYSGDIMATAYYPIVGTYHFSGFHIDDAEASAKMTDYNSAIRVDVKYDGTQDIMIATDTANYTTRTARAGKHPNLKFEHQLTRLIFYVVAGNEKAAVRDFEIKTDSVRAIIDSVKKVDTTFLTKQGVILDSVIVKNQYNTGYVHVNCDSATWHFNNGQNDSKADFLVNMHERIGGKKAKEALKVGDMLVNPEDIYEADFAISEYIDQLGFIVDNEHKKRHYNNIRIAPPKPELTFKPGTSYDVTITVYALENIIVTASLTGWKDGGQIDLVPDDDDPKPTTQEPGNTTNNQPAQGGSSTSGS